MTATTIIRKKMAGLLFRRWILDSPRRVADIRRRVLRKNHVLSVFLELDDPYSYLLSHYLPSLARQYDIELRLYLAQAIGGDFRPHADRQATYAEDDCERVAVELGVPFLDRGHAPPVEYRKTLLNALADNVDRPEFDAELLHAIELYWRGDTAEVGRRASDAGRPDTASAVLTQNQALLGKLGHYDCATIHYGGEWYSRVDRLPYLMERLDALGARRKAQADPRLESIRQSMHMSLPVTPPSAARELPPLELFFSFRSPYSYLCLQRACSIAEAFGLPLTLRPVLPMMMRGMPVPWRKIVYFARDASREAERKNIAFGRFADPGARGIERCLAVFMYALSEKRGRDFAINACEAIWARGIDVATDRGMRKVTGKTGLFWPDVKAVMDDDAWRPTEEDNRASLMESGAWGVPTMRLGEFVTWGQDRDWLLVRHIEELCDTGDGILI